MTTTQQAQKRKKAISCRNKRAFPDEAKAQALAGRMNKAGKYVKPYRCDICHGWHICKRDRSSVLADLFDKIEQERGKRT